MVVTAILQRANSLWTDRILSMLLPRAEAERQTTARYVREEKSCFEEDRETSVMGKELYKSLQTLETWGNTNGFVITTLWARLKTKSKIVLAHPDKALAYVHGVSIKFIDGVITSSPDKQLEIFEGWMSLVFPTVLICYLLTDNRCLH